MQGEEIDKAGAYQKGRAVVTKSIEAVQKGDFEGLKSLLGKDPHESLQEISEGKNRKLIHFAAIFGHINILEWIVENGGDPYALDDDHNSISSLAAYNERLEVLSYILEKFPGLLSHQNAKKMTLLHIAAESCNFPIVSLLLSKGLDINSESENGTPLELSVMWKRIEMSKFLLEKGADPNGSYGKYFPPPLVMAASMNNREIVQLLLGHKADVSLSGDDKVTAIEVAFEFDFDFIDDLLNKGAKVTGKALLAAIKNSKHGVVERFLGISPVGVREVQKVVDLEAEEFKVKGNEEFAHKNFIGAVELYTKAIEICENTFYYSNRSQAFNMQGKYEEGLRDARAGRSLDSGNVKAVLREAQALEGLERYLEAAGCYWKAYLLQKNPAIYTALVGVLDRIV